MTSISIVIPTYQRGAILLNTLEQLFAQDHPADEIILVDQSVYPEGDATAESLAALDQQGRIVWMRLPEPSIPHAMNAGLQAANSETVLFLDDDIRIAPEFVQSHLNAFIQHDCPAQVGCVLQPGETKIARSSNYYPSTGLWVDLSFPFNSDQPALIENCMAGNLLVRKKEAIACGGFDQNFQGAAYRFETEFCRRLSAYAKKKFYYAPNAKIDHLRAERGGTRELAGFLTSSTSLHSAGDYYFAQCCGTPWEAFVYSLRRITFAVVAKFYLRRPWYIPVRLVGELRGIFKSFRLRKQGAQLLS